MTRFRFFIPVAIGVAALALVIVSVLTRPSEPPSAKKTSRDPVIVSPSPPPFTPPPPPPTPPQIVDTWRSSIRDNPGVNRATIFEIEQIFEDEPETYRETLLKMAREDETPRVRAFTITVLSRYAKPPPEDFFIERLSDPEEYPREAALHALEKGGTSAALSTLDRLANSDPFDRLKALAKQVAGKIRASKK